MRTALVVLAWVTVSGGAVMAAWWFIRGGARALGPEDDDMAGSSARARRREPRVTSFSTAQVAMHGLLGVLTAITITYGATLDDDRTGGYVALLGAIAITAVPGLLMFRKWHAGTRPGVATGPGRPDTRRVEDRLHPVIVFGHGLAAFATAALLVWLLALD